MKRINLFLALILALGLGTVFAQTTPPPKAGKSVNFSETIGLDALKVLADKKELLEVEKRIGIKLTESASMWPASSVSGFYFFHPEAKYFNAT